MSYRPRYNNNGTLEDLPIDAETVKGHEMENTGILSNTDTIPTTAQVKSYVDSNEKYHTPSSATGVKIATGTGVADMYVPTGTDANTVCVGNDSRLSNSRTPTAHASSDTTYGVGTSSNYGHVKVISGDLNGKSAIDGYAASQSHAHSNYQDKLISGTNLKTINNQSLLGSGNINISGSAGAYHHATCIYQSEWLDIQIHWWSNTESQALSGTNLQKIKSLYVCLDNIGKIQTCASGWFKYVNKYFQIINSYARYESDEESTYEYLVFDYIDDNGNLVSLTIDTSVSSTPYTITDIII